MKVDLDGLARNIKSDLIQCARFGQSARMVDEMVRTIKELQAIVEPLEELRREDGASVLIPCDNADFDGPGSCVEVSDDWTDWEPRRFTGDNLAAALKAAVEAKRKREAQAKEGH